MADMLHKYLSSGLLDIGDDDSRLAKLREAAGDLQKLFASTPRNGLYQALMVYSEKVEPEDQCFAESAEALSKHWNTYQNKYKDTPRGLFRAMAIHALSESTAANADLAAAVAYGLRSLGQHPNTANEGPILEEFYRETSNKLEERATAAWRLNSPNALPPLKPPSVSAPAVEKATLDAGISPDTITATLTKLANGMATDVNKNLKTLTDHISTGIGAMQQSVRDTGASSFLRSELLWWKESRFSPILRKPYRVLEPNVASLFMALDLHAQLPGISPLSVDYFLSETVTEITGPDKRTTWTQLISDVTSDPSLAEALLRSSPNVTPRHGVRTLIERLREDVEHKQTGSRITKSTGKATKEAELELSGLAVKVFLALQALRFSAEKTDGKKV